MLYYFAYGSNLWLNQMRERCPGCRDAGMGVLNDFRWIISRRGYATVVPSSGDVVHGRVFELSAEDEHNLDHCEKVDEGMYLKYHLPIRLAGNTLICLVYVDPVTAPGLPQPEYITRINNAISDSPFPREYVLRTLRRFVPADDDEHL